MFGWQAGVLSALILVLVNNTILSIYLHRSICHRQFIFHPAVVHFFRFYVWLFCFIDNHSAKHWSATHRIHHEKPDTVDDPHSPYFFSFIDLIFKLGVTPGAHYVPPDQIKQYSKDIPILNDWLERNIYKQSMIYPSLILIILFFVLFGQWGILIAIVMLFVASRGPFILAYFTHFKGYRHRPATGTDQSVNMYPLAIIWGGEELGANHHDDIRNPKFSEKWWEVDPGWGVIRFLKFFGLVKLHTDK